MDLMTFKFFFFLNTSFRDLWFFSNFWEQAEANLFFCLLSSAPSLVPLSGITLSLSLSLSQSLSLSLSLSLSTHTHTHTHTHVLNLMNRGTLSYSLSLSLSLSHTHTRFKPNEQRYTCLVLSCLAPFRRRRWHPTPVLLPGKSHGWRSLVGCSPWGHWGSDMTERLHFHFSLSCIGEGNGNLLQCSCLENPRDGAGPGGLPSMGSHRVGHDWSDLAAAAAAPFELHERVLFLKTRQAFGKT